MTDCKNFYLLLALATLFSSHPLLRAQERRGGEPVLQMCSEYSRAGDLLKASISAHSFVLSIARQGGRVADLAEHIPEVVTISQPASSIVPCQLVVSATSDRAALAIPTGNGIILELIDLTTGQLTHMVRVLNKFPIQFSLHPVGYVDGSSQLAVSQAHYLPTGEPEVATVLVNSDGSITSVPHNVLGPQYTEVSSSSFDFRGGRVWFLCPTYSARIDRQPRCTLTSAPLLEASAPRLEISTTYQGRLLNGDTFALRYVDPLTGKRTYEALKDCETVEQATEQACFKNMILELASRPGCLVRHKAEITTWSGTGG